MPLYAAFGLTTRRIDVSHPSVCPFAVAQGHSNHPLNRLSDEWMFEVARDSRKFCFLGALTPPQSMPTETSHCVRSHVQMRMLFASAYAYVLNNPTFISSSRAVVASLFRVRMV